MEGRKEGRDGGREEGRKKERKEGGKEGKQAGRQAARKEQIKPLKKIIPTYLIAKPNSSPIGTLVGQCTNFAWCSTVVR